MYITRIGYKHYAISESSNKPSEKFSDGQRLMDRVAELNVHPSTRVRLFREAADCVLMDNPL